MSKFQKLAVTAGEAAKMLSLALPDFLLLVEMGALPPPIPLGSKQRWVVAQIESVLSGQEVEQEDFVV